MYIHTQRAAAIPLVFGVAAPLALLAVAIRQTLPTGARAAVAASAVVMVGAGVAFSRLTIQVTDSTLTWHFGPGVWRKEVPVADIAAAAPTTTSFADGWGIHLTRHGWLYNVAGRRAVLITRRDGRTFLLGTDDPDGLVAALDGARGA